MPRGRDKLTIAVTVVCCAAAVGCGASGSAGNTGTSANPTLAIKFADCMRSHGVPDFPDPGSGQNAQAVLNRATPAFQAAGRACAKVGGPEGHGIPASAATRRSLIADSQCMRTHGVPNYPDPVFPGTGGVEIAVGNIDPQSPAFKAAVKVCGSPFPGGVRRRP
jgi:hypothetical protein